MGARAGRSAGGPVVLLTDLLGRPVVDAADYKAGRVGDLTVATSTAHPVGHRLLVRTGRRTAYLLPWGEVADAGDPVRLRTVGPRAQVDRHAPPLEADELLLARDVLDTEVVDLQGHRLSRVAEVVLLRGDDGRLEVAAVDVGARALLRRLGLGALLRRTAAVAVDWGDLHLTSSRGHVVQLSTGTAGFHRLDAAGLAELLARLSTGKAADVLRTVGPERAAAAVHRSHPATGRRLLHAIGRDEADRLVAAAAPDHAERLTELRRHDSPLRRRRFRRTAGWRVARPPGRRHPSGRG